MTWALGGSWVVVSRVISRVTAVRTYIRGLITILITTHEPPSMRLWWCLCFKEPFLLASSRVSGFGALPFSLSTVQEAHRRQTRAFGAAFFPTGLVGQRFRLL